MRHFGFVSLVVAVLLSGVAGGGAAADEAACKPLDLGFGSKESGWKAQPLSKLKRDTAYTLEQEGGRTVLKAAADRSASFYASLLKDRGALPPVLSWRWKTDALVPGADNRDKKREDAPLRVILAFDGDKSTLPDEEQKRFRRAQKLFGKDLPYAVLMYIWTDHVPVGTVIPSAHTRQVKMIAVASGTAGLGAWQKVRRTVADDYRRAFGGSPGPLLGVAVMTDTDNTGSKATGWYGDIRFECGER